MPGIFQGHWFQRNNICISELPRKVEQRRHTRPESITRRQYFRVLDTRSSGELEPGRVMVVSWYGPHDQYNPQFWPASIKSLIYIQIKFCTFIVYLASSIFSIVEPDFIQAYKVPTAVGSLGLALVLLSYGIGALLLSPLSEILAIGRNPPNIISLTLFIIVSGAATAVDHVPGLLVLRFLQGFLGSPCLATGAASLADITSLINIPCGLWIWGTCAVAAPAIAPSIAGFSVMKNGWKRSMWEILWGAAPCFIMMLFLPETSGPTILHKRAARLRALTDNQYLRAPSEIDGKCDINSILYGALAMPWKINALDPAIMFTTIYIALVYAIFYSFFEVVPLVYQGVCDMGLVFLAAIIAVLIAMPFYYIFIHQYIAKPIQIGSIPL
ncbi:hypothetical protein VI817_000072 [Penicillium citrinum]|nr:hypothetical protein VI817_000072 [Penicillium citrinum]